MTYDEAIEDLGGLVSQAGGEGYEALEAVKDEVGRLRDALAEVARCGRRIDAVMLAREALR